MRLSILLRAPIYTYTALGPQLGPQSTGGEKSDVMEWLNMGILVFGSWAMQCTQCYLFGELG